MISDAINIRYNATASGSQTIVAVKQIATAYEIRGMPWTITSYDSATATRC